MRIVNRDNFDGDYPDEWFVNVGPLELDDANKIVDILNRDWDESSPRYYQVVDNDYKLLPGFEP